MPHLSSQPMTNVFLGKCGARGKSKSKSKSVVQVPCCPATTASYSPRKASEGHKKKRTKKTKTRSHQYLHANTPIATCQQLVGGVIKQNQFTCAPDLRQPAPIKYYLLDLPHRPRATLFGHGPTTYAGTSGRNCIPLGCMSMHDQT